MVGREVGGVGGVGRHGEPEVDVTEGEGEGEAEVEGSSEAAESNDEVEEALDRRWPCATDNVTGSQSARCVCHGTRPKTSTRPQGGKETVPEQGCEVTSVFERKVRLRMCAGK